MGILQITERSVMKAICGVHFNCRKSADNVMLMLRLNEAINVLAMACWVLRM